MQQLATGLEPVMGQPAITRLEQMYVIAKLEQGQYVYYNQNTKKFSPKDNHASKWTSISAAREALHKLEEKQALKENLLNSLTDEFQTQKAPVVSDYSQKFIRRSQEEVLAQVKETVLFLRHLGEIASLLRKEISEADGTVLQDLLHTIELGDYRAHEGLVLLKDLRASRKKRRYYKDRQQAVNYLLTKANTGQVTTTSDKAQVALTKLGDLQVERNYKYRNSGLQAKYAKLLGKQPVQSWVQLFTRLRKR
ncbi:hypothetical protein M5361_04880 [Ligilactobacillus agilis]|nr:hypothetical protein [Ligilactobacillus agilis]